MQFHLSSVHMAHQDRFWGVRVPQVRGWLERDMQKAHGMHWRDVVFQVKIGHYTRSGSATAIITSFTQYDAESLFRAARRWFAEVPKSRHPDGWMFNTCKWWDKDRQHD